MASQLVVPTLEGALIADTATRAHQLLICCREIIHEEIRKLVTTQLARFNLWASNIGVFAARHASLGYRLRTALSIKATVEGNLDMVCKYLLMTLKGSTELSEEEFNTFFDNPASHVSVIGKELLLKSTPNDYVRIKQLKLVEDRITILHQLSLAIRRASIRTNLTKIPRLFNFDAGYKIIKERREDDKGPENVIDGIRFDIGIDFEEFVRKALVHRWLRPHLNDEEDLNDEQKSYKQTLLERCITAVSTRRRQLTYFRVHQSRLEKNDKVASRLRSRPDETPAQRDELQPTEQAESKDPFPAVSKGPNLSPSNYTHEETVVSELVVTNFRTPLTISAPSSSASTTADGGFGGGGPFDVPPPPTLEENEKEKACPYCYLVLPAKTFSTQKRAKRWERHLLEDLQPYICLFANCNMPGKTYSSFTAWKSHLSQPHYHSWSCSLHSKDGSNKNLNDESLTFDTLEKFRSHLKIFHPGLGTTSTGDPFQHEGRLAALPEWCFVCFDRLPQTDNLLKHMVQHFKSMSLLALPWREDIPDEEAILSDKPATSGSTNNNDDDDDFNVPNFRGLEKAVMEQTRKHNPEEFASLLSAINETSLHQDRLRNLEIWTRNWNPYIRTERTAQRNWRLFRNVMRAVWRFRRGEGIGWQEEQQSKSRDLHLPLQNRDYTVGWICALPVEFAPSFAMLDSEHPPLPQDSGDHNSYTLGRIGRHNVVMACLPSGESGTASASSVLNDMKRTFKLLRFCLMVGIGGAVPDTPKDIRLGDIVISNPSMYSGGVIQYDADEVEHSGIFVQIGALNMPSKNLQTAITNLQLDHETSGPQFPKYLEDMFTKYEKMRPRYSRPSPETDILFSSYYNHPEDKQDCSQCDPAEIKQRKAFVSKPRVHLGLIASANKIMKHGVTRDILWQQYGIECFETEAAGLTNSNDCLVIRGISDYADSHKNDLWQSYAAGIAAAYAKELLRVTAPDVWYLIKCHNSPTTNIDIDDAFLPHDVQITLSLDDPRRLSQYWKMVPTRLVGYWTLSNRAFPGMALDVYGDNKGHPHLATAAHRSGQLWHVVERDDGAVSLYNIYSGPNMYLCSIDNPETPRRLMLSPRDDRSTSQLFRLYDVGNIE